MCPPVGRVVIFLVEIEEVRLINSKLRDRLLYLCPSGPEMGHGKSRERLGVQNDRRIGQRQVVYSVIGFLTSKSLRVSMDRVSIYGPQHWFVECFSQLIKHNLQNEDWWFQVVDFNHQQYRRLREEFGFLIYAIMLAIKTETCHHVSTFWCLSLISRLIRP